MIKIWSFIIIFLILEIYVYVYKKTACGNYAVFIREFKGNI